MNHLHAYWVEKNNFGDLLTPLIVRHLSGREPVRVEPNAPVEHFFVVGSTLHFATPLTTVWGTGIIYWRSAMLPDPRAKLAMTRGPLSYSFQPPARTPESAEEPHRKVSSFGGRTHTGTNGLLFWRVVDSFAMAHGLKCPPVWGDPACFDRSAIATTGPYLS